MQYHKEKRLPQKTRLELKMRRVKDKTKWKGTPLEYCMILYALQNVLRKNRAPYANEIPRKSPLLERRAASLKITRTASLDDRPHIKSPDPTPRVETTIKTKHYEI